MKIGFSYSRCVLDIVEGTVNMDDVLVVISRTDFDPHNDEQWKSIWRGYTDGRGFSAREWYHYDFDDEAAEQKFRAVTIELWNQGKLHQPRQFGAHPARAREHWVDTGPLGYELFVKPEAVQEAWRNYQVLSNLTQ